MHERTVIVYMISFVARCLGFVLLVSGLWERQWGHRVLCCLISNERDGGGALPWSASRLKTLK